MGGEKTGTPWRWLMVTGSPPHGRGKVDEFLRCVHGIGITPAWAGKRDLTMPESLRARDHPRMGGEKYLALMSSESDRGSPPHGRGKVVTTSG